MRPRKNPHQSVGITLSTILFSILLGILSSTTRAQNHIPEDSHPTPVTGSGAPCFLPDSSPSGVWRRDPEAQPIACNDILEPPPAADTQPYPKSASDLDFTLAVYYVVPADIDFDQDVLDTVKEATFDIQAWYQLATGGITWNLAFPEVVRVYHAMQARQFYVDNENWWGSLLAEMDSQGLYIWSPGIVTAIWAHGAGWWAGAAQGYSKDCGVALLGVEVFPEFNNPAYSGGICPDPDGFGVEAWPCVPMGAFAHELGHTVGLTHPADAPSTSQYASHSIMQTHWNYPNEAPAGERPWGFLTNERQSMQASSFMQIGLDLVQKYQNLEAVVNLPVTGTSPSVDFDVNAVEYSIQTINNTHGATLQYWTFGDFSVSNEISPTRTFTQSSSYTVTLCASSESSMMAIMHKKVTLPIAVIYLPIVVKNLN